MTPTELKNFIRATLIATRTIAQEITVFDEVIDFITSSITTGIPAWTSSLSFNTDGSGDGSFCTYADSNGALRFWKTKTDTNVNNAPPTNPATTETTYWIEVSPASGSAIKEWTPGIYGSGIVIVYFDDSGAGTNPALYMLTEAVRPFESTDFDTELAANSWVKITGVAGGGAWGTITGDITDQADLVAYIASAVAGLMDYRGTFDASVNAYPSSGGSGTAGTILKSDFWIVSVAGTLPTGLAVAPGDLIIAKQDTPGNTEANWSIVEYNIGYTAENAANKTGTVSGNESSTTLYAHIKGMVDWLKQGFTSALSAKTTPIDADSVLIEDSADSNKTKKTTWANIKSTIKAYLRPADVQSVTSAATVTPNADTDDMVKITAQAAALELANPSGTPTEGQMIVIRIKDNGTSRAISYGTQYRPIGVTLPTTTVISKTLYLPIVWNATDSKWDVIGVKQEA